MEWPDAMAGFEHSVEPQVTVLVAITPVIGAWETWRA